MVSTLHRSSLSLIRYSKGRVNLRRGGAFGRTGHWVRGGGGWN